MVPSSRRLESSSASPILRLLVSLRLVFVGLCFSGLVVQQSNAATASFTIPVKFLPNYALLIQVRVNGSSPFLCQFDSGAGTSFVLDRDKAKGERLRPTTTGTSAGVGPAKINDERLPGATLDLGPLQIANQTVVMFPTGPENCIFGSGILKDFVVQIDYVTATVRLYDPQTFTATADAINVPFTLSAGSPMVDSTITFGSGDPVRARLLVDTAVRRFLALSKGFTDDHRIIERVPRVVKPPFIAGGTGGRIDLLATRLGALSIGAGLIQGPIALLIRTASGASRTEPDGYLGNEFFRRFLLTLDYPHMRLLLEPNQNYHDPPTPYDGSGLGIEEKDGILVVTAIAPGSAAADAGVALGDILISLDGEPASRLAPERVQERLCRLTGKSIVQIQRGDHVLTFTLSLRPVL
jgi:hypothetical protein